LICPYCNKNVSPGDKRCPHCKAEPAKPESKKSPQSTEPDAKDAEPEKGIKDENVKEVQNGA
jgi:predicted amidophosphoribosyltransferase